MWQRVRTRPKFAQVEAEQELSITPEFHILWSYAQKSHRVHQHEQNQNPRMGQVKRDLTVAPPSTHNTGLYPAG